MKDKTKPDIRKKRLVGLVLVMILLSIFIGIFIGIYFSIVIQQMMFTSTAVKIAKGLEVTTFNVDIDFNETTFNVDIDFNETKLV